MASDDRIIIPDDDVSIYSPTVPTMQDGAHGISLFANTPGDILVLKISTVLFLASVLLFLATITIWQLCKRNVAFISRRSRAVVTDANMARPPHPAKKAD